MPLELIQRSSPVLVTLPYTGTNMPSFIMERLRDHGPLITSPDRGLDRLLHGLVDEFSLLRANFHRFVSDVDAIPPTVGTLLKKGMMGVVPLLSPTGESLWDVPPAPRDTAAWRAMYFAPYHAALAAQIAQTRARHGFAVIVNIKAIHATPDWRVAPLSPDVRLSTNMRTSCSVDLSSDVSRQLREYDFSLDIQGGRDRGGWTIRHYGRPKTHVHALSLELNETQYLDLSVDDVQFDAEKASLFRHMLSKVLKCIAVWHPQGYI